MDSHTRLADYLAQVSRHCQHELNQWYNLDELGLDALALTALHFLHTAIDRNESAGGRDDNYLLTIPDTALADSALSGALVGALLGKYRANYIMADSTPPDYAIDDILLLLPRQGQPKLQRVISSNNGKINYLTAFPHAAGNLAPPTHSNFVKLLPVAEARRMGENYTIHSAARLAANIQGIKKLVKGIEGMVAVFPHRLGLVCSPAVLSSLLVRLPLPIRDWPQGSGEGKLQLPLPPLVEAARSYDTLKRKAFAAATTSLVCDELLILDVAKYCDGNGLFDNILDGRSMGRYRNLVLVGSRPPKGGRDFHSWEWTPEELAVLRGLPYRLPTVQPCAAPMLRQIYQDLKTRLAELAEEAGLRLPGLLPTLALFCRLVLPPTSRDAQREAERQTASLLTWVASLLTDDAFAEADLWGDERTEIRADLLGHFTALAAALRQQSPKFDAVKEACAAPTATTWPKGQKRRGKLPPVVLVVPRREAAATEAALCGALTDGHAARLQVISTSQLDWAVAQPALNRPEAVWLLPALRLSREEGSELTLYRQLLLLRAQVRILAYAGIEDGRAEQVAATHEKLVQAALAHPGRAHFVGELKIAPATAPTAAVPTAEPAPAKPAALCYVPPAPPDAATLARFADLDELFGPPTTGRLAQTWVPAAAPSAEATKEADQAETPEPAPPADLAADEPEAGEGKSSLSCELRFADELVAWPALGRVYVRPPAQKGWLARTAAELLAGDEVFLVSSNPQALRQEIHQRHHATMQEIDQMADLWKSVLRGLLQDFYSHDVDRLYGRLKWKGLRVRQSSLHNWLNANSRTRFPELASDLRAIAELEAYHRGSQAKLSARLSRIEAARRCNDRLVASYSRSFNSQVHRYLLDNAAIPDDPALAALLKAARPRKLLSIKLPLAVL